MKGLSTRWREIVSPTAAESEKVANLFGRHRREVLVPEPDCRKWLGLGSAHDVISFQAHASTHVGRCHRDCHCDPLRCHRAEGRDCRPHRGAGRQPVIDKDHRLAACGQWLGPFSVQALSFFELLERLCGYSLDRCWWDPKAVDDRAFDGPDPTRRDGTQGQFLVAGYAQLADTENVERRSQLVRHFICDRYPAARQAKNQQIGLAGVSVETHRKLSTGGAAVNIWQTWLPGSVPSAPTLGARTRVSHLIPA